MDKRKLGGQGLEVSESGEKKNYSPLPKRAERDAERMPPRSLCVGRAADTLSPPR